MSAEVPVSEKEITLADALEHGLSEAEFARIREFLGRTPTPTELGIYSGLWSEHCSYKNSILLLKTLPTESSRALTKTGEENAGALDIGDGLAVVFKVESHNHPTAVEPYQGAATGVGGIMRDIFTMGARPICSLNSLRFGPGDFGRNQYLLRRAVKGIGDYGNCLGIAVSGGGLFFDESFSRNPLVNAMTVGIVASNKIAKARAEGPGNPVFYVGATTGRDGIHGASFASQDLSQESEQKRSAVQVGDPFMEKLLLEATLELIASGAIVGIQDMGAAGLSCSTSEMSAKGGTGMDIDLDLVPFRETGMNAYEAMLSESQERMLVVVHRGQEETVRSIFRKWDLNAVAIGVVTDDGLLRIRREGVLRALIPADSLVLGGGAPRYEREQKRPAYLDEVAAYDPRVNPAPASVALPDLFARLIASPNLCSRRPLYEQYDTEVGLVRVLGPGGDGGLSRIPGTRKGIASAVDCNSRYVYLDPRRGTAAAVFESARNVAVTGAEPLGITNCLNFGNPYVPENYYIFAEAIAGMREACLALGLPVTGGNVSFYNESEDGPVLPTPTIGMVGLLDDVDLAVPAFFRRPGDLVFLLGRFRPTLGGSEFLKTIHGVQKGRIPAPDADAEKRLIRFLTTAARRRLLRSARDLSLGGLTVALFKSAYDPESGRSIGVFARNMPGELRAQSDRPDEFYFGETGATALVSVWPENRAVLEALAAECELECFLLGTTNEANALELPDFHVDLTEAVERFENGLVDLFR